MTNKNQANFTRVAAIPSIGRFRLPQIACMAVFLAALNQCPVGASHASPAKSNVAIASTGTVYNILIGGQVETIVQNIPSASAADGRLGNVQLAMSGTNSLAAQSGASDNKLKTALITLAGQGGGPGTLDGTGDTARLTMCWGWSWTKRAIYMLRIQTITQSEKSR